MFCRTPRVAPPAATATLCPEVGNHRRAVEPRRGFGVGKGLRWTTRPGRPASTPCLTGSPGQGPRRGRRSPYRHPRQGRQDGGGQGGLDVSGPTYAALDLGTNNCRLLVARATRDSFRVIDAFSRIIRLGEGITSSGRAERGRDPARGRRAARLPRQDAQPRRHPLAPDRDRGLPLGRQRPRFPGAHPQRGRHRAGDRRSRDRGAARRHRLHAAGRSGGRGRDPVRHRRRLLRARSARPLLAHASTARRIPRSRPGSRSRSAS